VILEKEGPNDGLVSVESAKWVSELITLAFTSMDNFSLGNVPWNTARRQSSGLGLSTVICKIAIYLTRNVTDWLDKPA
jgi:hypothetical protein